MLRILDSTLREGEQTPGVCFDLHIKLAIADLLAAIGVDIIEAGHPAVTEEIHQAVRMIAGRGLRPLVGAHARSLEADVEMALECGVGFLGIFYCVSEERLADRATDLDNAVARIAAVVRLAKARKPELIVRYTPEDAVRSPFSNVVTAAAAACAAGADVISIADTTGFMIPGTARSFYDYVARLRDDLAARGFAPQIAVHCHNDRGLALANALDAMRAGANIIDASVLGLGERAGIVDLGTLLAVLAQDFGYDGRWELKRLPELYRLVSQYAGVPVPVNLPVTGKNAFTHCAGVHTQAAIRNPMHYQSLDPAIVGREPTIALDHMAGMAALRFSLARIGHEHMPDGFARLVLKRVKEVGQSGRTVDLEELRYIVLAVLEHENRYGNSLPPARLSQGRVEAR
ncbi:MAG: 2-isopropylmalate synthase [Thermoanaerobaculales bacterium]